MNVILLVYDDPCPGKTKILKWHSLFKPAREFPADEPRPDWSIEVITPVFIRKVEKIILDETRLKKKQLAEKVGPFLKSCFTKVSARWALRMLTPRQNHKVYLDILNHPLYWPDLAPVTLPIEPLLDHYKNNNSSTFLQKPIGDHRPDMFDPFAKTLDDIISWIKFHIHRKVCAGLPYTPCTWI